MTYKFDKRLLIGIGVFIVVGYLIATILRVLTPKTPKLEVSNLVVTNLDQTTTSFQNVRFVGGTRPDVPPQFGIYQASIANKDDQMLSDLSAAFSLTPMPGVKDLYTGPEYTLSTTKKTQWMLSRKSTLPSIEVVEPEVSITVAENFNAEYLQNSFAPYQSGLEYYEATQTEFDESSPDRGNLVSIPFALTTDGYPVFFQNQDTFPVILYVTSDPVILRAEFNPAQALLGQKTADLSSISLNQAVANINQNQGAIIRAGQNEFGQMDLTQISNAELESASIEYRVDKELGLAYPFYRFAGTAQNTAGVTLEVEIITPAVATRTP